MAFRGWPADALDFYAALEADNSKAFWQANKGRYEAGVKGPFEALMAELEPDYGPMRLFRPYRDVRFSKDKTPYKLAAAVTGEREGGSTLYLQLSTAGLLVASGQYHMASDQLQRFRAAVDDDTTGTKLAELCAALERSGQETGAHDELKTAPKGYSKDHPRIGLLRRKGLIVSRSYAPAPWLHTAKAKGRIVKAWNEQEPLDDWLERHVGPSELPPEDGWR